MAWRRRGICGSWGRPEVWVWVTERMVCSGWGENMDLRRRESRTSRVGGLLNLRMRWWWAWCRLHRCFRHRE